MQQPCSLSRRTGQHWSYLSQRSLAVRQKREMGWRQGGLRRKPSAASAMLRCYPTASA